MAKLNGKTMNLKQDTFYIQLFCAKIALFKDNVFQKNRKLNESVTKSMRCKFLQDIYLEYFVILDLAGKNLAQTLLNPLKFIWHC